MIILRWGTEEDEVRCGGLDCFSGEQVKDQVGSSMERLHPEGGRGGCLEQKGANNIISGTNNALSFIILGGDVGANMRMWTPCVRKNVALELSNSLPLLQWTALIVMPNWVCT